MANPYLSAPLQAFWRHGVAASKGEDFSHLFTPKFSIDQNDVIATAGSCFAQHISRALIAAGCRMLDAEPAPRQLPPDTAKAFGYGLYSGRYGNIYTARQMRELLEEIFCTPAPPVLCWPLGAGWVDALRPRLEPEGLASQLEVAVQRKEHLAALKARLPECSLFVFTLGMTEAWQDLASGRTLPVCPGVIAGSFSDLTTRFVTFRYPEVMEDLTRLRNLLHRLNPKIRLLLTVSPVPLAATASGRHVLAASTRSKATLRAAAEDFADAHADVDYFPSFEIVTSPAARSPRFEQNLRHVRAETVDAIMALFMQAYGLAPVMPKDLALAAAPTPAQSDDADDRLICEEALLDAFAPP